jgi:hypothetical protein
MWIVEVWDRFKQKNVYLIIGICAVVLFAYSFTKPVSEKINGLVMLIEFEHIEGVLN